MTDSIAYSGLTFRRRSDFINRPRVLRSPPSIISLNYDQGDTLGGGQSIIITGTDLTSATAVSFGGTSASITSNTATTVTCTLPAKSAGSTTVSVTTSAGTSNTLTFEFWDPSQLHSTTGFWEDYEGSPWAARGGNVGGNLTAPATAPSVGTGAGSATSVDTPGGNSGRYLRSGGTNYIENYISITSQNPSSGSTAWVLFKPRTAGVDGGTGTPYLNRGLITTNAGGYFIVSHTVNGFVCGYYDGAYDAVTAACTLGTGASGLDAWHLGVFTYNGTTMQASVDGSTLASASSAQSMPANPGSTYLLQVATDYSATNGFDGEILALGTTRWPSADAEVLRLRKWAMQRFGVTV